MQQVAFTLALKLLFWQASFNVTGDNFLPMLICTLEKVREVIKMNQYQLKIANTQDVYKVKNIICGHDWSSLNYIHSMTNLLKINLLKHHKA